MFFVKERVHPDPPLIDHLQHRFMRGDLRPSLGGYGPGHSVEWHLDHRLLLEFHLALHLARARFGLARLGLLVAQCRPRQGQLRFLLQEGET